MKSIALLQKVKSDAKTKEPKTNEWLWLNDISAAGWVLAVLTLLVVTSVFKSLRVPVGGLYLHLYMIPIIPLFLLSSLPRFDLFP